MAPAPSADLSADVVVIGGGPGGSTTATMLARKGWRVLLLERERFPRDHIGESLLPASMPVLEELGGFAGRASSGIFTEMGATMVWGTDKRPWSWYFRETNQRYPHSYRSGVLSLISYCWRIAERMGWRSAKATRWWTCSSKQAARGVRYTADGVAGMARARFVVDASVPGRAPRAQAAVTPLGRLFPEPGSVRLFCWSPASASAR